MNLGTYYLGVDGGGTKTEALISDAQGRILGRGGGGPSNPYFVSKRAALRVIVHAVNIAQLEAGGRGLSCAVVCVPGLRRHFDPASVAREMGVSEDRLNIAGDDLSTFYGALGGEHGVVVSAGTGSFAMGINREGERLSIGGWGPLLGDEGSGYSIGLDALKAVIRQYEGRGRKTALTPLIQEYYSITDINELKTCIYRRHINQKGISALTPLVLQGARAGDVVAIKIIESAGAALAEMAKIIIRRLKMDTREYDLVLTGGIGKLGDFIWVPFSNQVKKEFKEINIRKPRFVPAVGAVIIALEAGGLALSDKVLANLDQSYSRIAKSSGGDQGL
ncbi:MAG: BadF/BadG/BcrA/BcrD ATPase family protein [Chloroflexota bacterium]